MAIKVGINGFGRIGRNVLRSAVQNFGSDIEVVAINDPLEPDYLAYMLQYDSVHGRFQGEVQVDGGNIIVNGRKIRLTQERDPANLKWDEAGRSEEHTSELQTLMRLLSPPRASSHLATVSAASVATCYARRCRIWAATSRSSPSTTRCNRTTWPTCCSTTPCTAASRARCRSTAATSSSTAGRSA